MIKLFQHLRAAWVYATRVVIPESNEDWTKNDAASLRAFFLTPVGKKLLKCMSLAEASTMISAVNRGTPKDSGFAAGWRAHAVWLTQCAHAAQDTPEYVSSSEQGQEGEAALRERLSP